MKTIYFIRHGLSESNVAGRATGHTNSQLTPKGKAQATAAGKKARESGLVFDVIVSSPLDRAHDTAKLVAKEIGFPTENIIIDERLIERNMGALEGELFEKSGVTHDQYLKDAFALEHIDDIEKITDLQYRANQLLEEMVNNGHPRILLVSHGGLGRSLIRSAKNAPLTEHVGSLPNAELFRLI